MTREELDAIAATVAGMSKGTWCAADARAAWKTEWTSGSDSWRGPDCEGSPLCPDSEPDSHETRWTVARSARGEGWCTDTGFDGYGICEHDARGIAALRNAAEELIALARIGGAWLRHDADGGEGSSADFYAAVDAYRRTK